jgi:hypothetical protein
MFTIEHEFDGTLVTLVDDAGDTVHGDVSIYLQDDGVILEQADAHTDMVNRIRLSDGQVKDLIAALNLPEGTYQRTRSE